MADMRSRILVVEDEEKLRRVIALHLEDAGYEVSVAGDLAMALRLAERADLVLTDIRLPAGGASNVTDGLGLLAALQRQNARLPVIVMTAYGSVEIAVEAMKQGAADFLTKPFSLDHLLTVVRKALEVQSLREENVRLKEELGVRYQFDSIVGRSPKMQELLAAVERVAPARSTVLLCGESGVGKDLIARAIHHHSPRAAMPFVKINCTAIPESLMESELFGYEKGAFTGAAAARAGKFEQADGGTVMLDEIGDVPPAVQVKLLRVLQERELERLGSNKTRAVDVRVIAATNVDLRRALEEGNFREDLYYRLNVFPLTIPSLRERREDIPRLADHFVAKFRAEQDSAVTAISSEAMHKLVEYDWPGNVRELENVIERALVLAKSNVIQADEISLDFAPRRASSSTATTQGAAAEFLPEGTTLDDHERQLIREALRRAGGNKSQAARLLGLTRNALRYRLSQMGLE
jgi:DNA-binding NtrC family response regulator